MSDRIPETEATDAAAFRKWLKRNHATAAAVWLVFWKTDSGHPSIDWTEAVDQALCFGWIDSKVQSIDEHRYRRYFSVRKPGSIWSKINKEKIAELTATGQMMPAGTAAVDRAKKDGSWTILDDPEAGIVPPDLGAALDEAGARQGFDDLTPGTRKSILAWLAMAKREATRASRIDKTVTAATCGRSPL